MLSTIPDSSSRKDITNVVLMYKLGNDETLNLLLGELEKIRDSKAVLVEKMKKYEQDKSKPN